MTQHLDHLRCSDKHGFDTRSDLMLHTTTEEEMIKGEAGMETCTGGN